MRTPIGAAAEQAAKEQAAEGAGLRVTAHGLTVRARSGRPLLRGISLRAGPGELTVIAGSSGAGKTVLLETLAGIRAPAEGRVRYGGVAGPQVAEPAGPGAALGYVPQDDIIHRQLPVDRTLRYAARLRMPAGTPPAEVDAAVARALATLGLTGRARQPVAVLSGGERKRVSVAVELLTRPGVLFLDEPTSGLDPAAGAELMAVLREVAAAGTTVVLTTHTPSDLLRCDQVLFLSPGGTPAYTGSPGELRAALGVRTVEEAYGAVARAEGGAAGDGRGIVEGDRGTLEDDAGTAADSGNARPGSPTATAPTPAPAPSPARRLGPVGQWALLTRRNAEIMVRDRLGLAVLAGSPVMIVAMFAVLFRPGAFDPASPNPGSSAMILFWIAFGGFFFGLTYGLLQICPELPVVRRERLTVLRVGPYVLSKLTVLLPVLAAADALLLAVLRSLDRLPAAGWGVYGSLFTTTLLSSAAALALGLLCSAAVSAAGQATLLLPLLCFPQVLFSGAFVPVPQMAWPGAAISYAMTNRWAYEALGSGIGLADLWAHGGAPLGPPLLASYADSFDRPAGLGWLILAGFTVVLLAGTWAVLVRRCGRAERA
ncbi:ATP-binding cassette domain-containing protein [Streptomyces sp. TS71-3]|uniref:ATP-binding cassette domain-containing protein n=1 Tax=Streptomyces sp. TS71-3 TaxID=2733862 RepID=UPI001B0CFCDF|nr:ATP-binding cassette domain-containing protein [Streptomyces sp. TS71-3]GHJ36813.1 hypothetical protein Sm713_24220 [Streptomyces sp. TS71-3]